MQNFLFEYHEWIEALHVIAVISWMAGMLYLPRLFVYHCEAKKGSEFSEKLKIMEKRLLRYIMNPAMIAVWLLGLMLVYGDPGVMKNGWMHAKLTLVVLMTGTHGFFAATRKKFEKDENTRTQKFYRIVNEVPTVLMILIVIMVIVKPF